MYHTFESIESEIENYSSLKVCDILRESLICHNFLYCYFFVES